MFELTINKRFDAPVERIFAAWTKAETLQRWFGPGDIVVREAQVDFRVGGAYRIAMQDPEGKMHIVGGVYRAIVDNEKLGFTWRWEGSDITSDVEILLQPAGGQTDLILTHRQLPTAEMRDHHRMGWDGCLLKLTALQ